MVMSGEPQKSRIEVLEEVVKALIDKLETLSTSLDKLSKTAVKKSAQRFGAEHTRKAVKDTKTGKVYPSMYAAGKVVGLDYRDKGVDPDSTAAFYQIKKVDPDRLEILAADSPEAIEIWKKADEEVQKQVEEANKGTPETAPAPVAGKAKSKK